MTPPSAVLVDVDGDGRPDLVTPAGASVGPSNPVADPSAAALVPLAGELEEEYDALPVPVDPPALPASLERFYSSRQRARLEPVLPDTLKTWHGWLMLANVLATFYGHVALFYAVRAPLLAGRLLVLAPRGAARSLRAVNRWVTDEETAVLQRLQAYDQRNAEMHLKLTKQRRGRTGWRWIVLLSGAVGVVVALVVLAAEFPTWWHPRLLLAGVVVGLARLGTTPGQAVLGRAVTKFDAPKLTHQVVDQALAALGIAALSQAYAKGGPGVTYPDPIVREGQGWLAKIDLPHGVTADDVVERRPRLASGLRRPVGAVWPYGDPDPDMHNGRLLLWVGDRPFSKLAQPAWPLLRRGEHDMFNPVPYGFDQRGRLVTIGLMFANLLVGAIPRQGKTMAVRVVTLAAALDPRCELHAFELKGTGDLRAVEPVAHRYGSGADDETLRRVMGSIREVHGYLEPRAKKLASLPRHQVPENKVTPELARRADLHLHPVLLTVDEVQELFESEHGAEATDKLSAIIKRGPALGIMLVLATQKPDAASLPTKISSNMGVRLALRVMDWQSNDMILGTGAYKAGIKANLLTDADKGVGYLRDGGAVTVVRSSYIDAVMADKIGARARELRELAGTLTGDAAGIGPAATVTVNVVDDVRRVFAGDETALWGSVILERLAELRPEVYGRWKPAQLTAALKAKGVSAGRQVERADPDTGERRNQRGVYLEDLPRALEPLSGSPSTAINS